MRKTVSCVVVALAAGATRGLLLERASARPAVLTEPLARDELVTLRFGRGVPAERLPAFTLAADGADAVVTAGTFLAGRPFEDGDTGRRVVVRPEALTEYYRIEKGLAPDAAEFRTARILRRVDASDLRLLRAIDRDFRVRFGPSAGYGTRLDAPAASAAVPPLGATDDAGALRALTCGSDAAWGRYVTQGDASALAELAQSGAERFVRTSPSGASRYAQRQHRRVLFLRDRRSVSFVPEIPDTAHPDRDGLRPAAAYELQVPRPLRLLAALRARDGARLDSDAHAVRFDVTAAVPGHVGADAPGSAPHVVAVTPPNGETLVEPTTDWESPDDVLTLPESERRAFRVRVRFAQPLDPRTVDPATCALTRVRAGGVAVSQPVPVDVELVQSRLGDVVVVLTPLSRPDPQSRYEARISGEVRALDGTRLGLDRTTAFETR